MEILKIEALGQKVELIVPDDNDMIDDSVWRLFEMYQPYCASRAIENQGVAVDIGAGIGVFAIPFAKAFPDITLYCFEPILEYFEILEKNIINNGLSNVKAFNMAVTGTPAGLMTSKGFDQYIYEPGHTSFWRNENFKCYLSKSDDDSNRYPSIPVVALSDLNVGFAKVVAPGFESDIYTSLIQCGCKHVVSESWFEVDVASMYKASDYDTEFFVRFAGQEGVLRKDKSVRRNERDGLDIIVSMYNTKDYIVECIDSLINNDDDDVKVIVINDGSTDGCENVVEKHFSGSPRVRVVNKPNGGCASARNYGLRVSNATHIAFVDADDLVDPGFFSELLNLSRITNSEMVQAGFDFYEEQSEGESKRTPSYEDDLYRSCQRNISNGVTYFRLDAKDMIVSQPAIWRRVYRRDFIDNKDLYFPEHIRAFDDQIFQIQCLQYVDSVPMIDGPKYLYRQHPNQDIKQGDERHFYELEMFRLLIKKGLKEGWRSFDPIFLSFVNTINWSLSNLREDLRGDFIKGASEVFVYAMKAVGRDFSSQYAGLFKNQDIKFQIERLLTSFHGDNFVFSYLDSVNLQPGFIKAAQSVSKTVKLA